MSDYDDRFKQRLEQKKKESDFPETFKFTRVGEEVVFAILGSNEHEFSTDDKRTVLTVLDGQGKEWSLWLGKSLLEEWQANGEPGEGKRVAIRFLEEKKGKMANPFKSFAMIVLDDLPEDGRDYGSGIPAGGPRKVTLEDTDHTLAMERQIEDELAEASERQAQDEMALD